MYKIMTAGPTCVRENVRMARSLEFTNPDMDLDFYEFYRETCKLFSKALNTESETFIMGGEGILGLEAACASLIEPGDRVLVIDNGIFGKGFQDFVKMYRGIPVLFTSDYHRPIDVDELKKFLAKDSDFKFATVVHCDTPSGVLNDVQEISRILDKHNIMTVADSVAGMFGEPLDLSDSKIDILCGGSQKVLSAPPGLTIVWVSKRAFEVMENRKTPIASYYANILVLKDYYKNKWFPYTMPISDINGIRVAIENYLSDKDIFARHRRIAKATREALTKAGIELYLEEGWSNTVTVFKVPERIKDTDILDTMCKEHGIMISGCFDVLAGKVLRIGHMGENCTEENVAETLEALGKTYEKLGISLNGDLRELFSEYLK